MSKAFTTGALVTGALTFAASLLAPTAHADPLDALRGAVNTVRAQSTCPALTYDPRLEAAAQGYARAGNPPVDGHGYPGQITPFWVNADPTERAEDILIGEHIANIKDCTFKDFGVGMVWSDTFHASVTLVMGVPDAPAVPPPGGGNDPAPNKPPPVIKRTGKVANQLTVHIDGPTDGQITFRATNTYSSAVQCTYDATKKSGFFPGQQEVKQDFSLDAGQTKPLPFPAPQLDNVYHVLMQCHGSYDGDPSYLLGQYLADVGADGVK
jgi:hypothetical protein